jgi:hypothetical protein
MICRIELYLKNNLYTYELIELPPYNYDLTARDNDEIYQKILNAYGRKLKTQNAKQVERCSGDAFTCAVFESNMHLYGDEF